MRLWNQYTFYLTVLFSCYIHQSFCDIIAKQTAILTYTPSIRLSNQRKVWSCPFCSVIELTWPRMAVELVHICIGCDMAFRISVKGIELTNFKWFAKKMPRPTTVAKILRLRELFFPCFLEFVKSKKRYQRKSSTLKHAVVNNSQFQSQNRIKNRQAI